MSFLLRYLQVVLQLTSHLMRQRLGDDPLAADNLLWLQQLPTGWDYLTYCVGTMPLAQAMPHLEVYRRLLS